MSKGAARGRERANVPSSFFKHSNLTKKLGGGHRKLKKTMLVFCPNSCEMLENAFLNPCVVKLHSLLSPYNQGPGYTSVNLLNYFINY